MRRPELLDVLRIVSEASPAHVGGLFLVPGRAVDAARLYVDEASKGNPRWWRNPDALDAITDPRVRHLVGQADSVLGWMEAVLRGSMGDRRRINADLDDLAHAIAAVIQHAQRGAEEGGPR